MAILSSLCKCLEVATQDVLRQMEGRVNRIIRDKTRLNNILKRAPAFSLTASALSTSLGELLDLESELTDALEEGFPFPGEGNISLGAHVRCIQNQIVLPGGIISAFCDLGRFSDILQNLIDDIIPKLDAQVSFGCDPGTVAGLQGSVDSLLGSVNADSTGKVDIETLTSDSAATVGESYINDFNNAVKCCVNITVISDNIKNFIVDPSTGQPYNPVTFAS